MKKNIIYLRVSTEEQKDEGHSIEFQKNRCLEYCKKENIDNYEIYNDAGYSARSSHRPKYLKMINEIKENNVDKVIFLKIDRISRSVLDYRNLTDICHKYDVELISMVEQIDNKTAIGKFNQNIIISLAELEREQISERTKNGYVGALEKGCYPFSKLPLGISRDENNKLYYNEESCIIKEIFKLVKEYTYQDVKRIIEKKYEITFSKNRIEQIVKNELYHGKKTYCGVEYPVIESLIEEVELIDVSLKSKERNILRHNYYFKNKNILKYKSDDSSFKCQTVKKKNGKVYKYYVSNDKQVKLNEKYLINILERELEKNKHEKMMLLQSEMQTLTTLLMEGDINREEYQSLKKRAENSSRVKKLLQKIIIDEDYNVFYTISGKEQKINYLEEVEKMKKKSKKI